MQNGGTSSKKVSIGYYLNYMACIPRIDNRDIDHNHSDSHIQMLLFQVAIVARLTIWLETSEDNEKKFKKNTTLHLGRHTLEMTA